MRMPVGDCSGLARVASILRVQLLARLAGKRFVRLLDSLGDGLRVGTADVPLAGNFPWLRLAAVLLTWLHFGLAVAALLRPEGGHCLARLDEVFLAIPAEPRPEDLLATWTDRDNPRVFMPRCLVAAVGSLVAAGPVLPNLTRGVQVYAAHGNNLA